MSELKPTEELAELELRDAFLAEQRHKLHERMTFDNPAKALLSRPEREALQADYAAVGAEIERNRQRIAELREAIKNNTRRGLADRRRAAFEGMQTTWVEFERMAAEFNATVAEMNAAGGYAKGFSPQVAKAVRDELLRRRA